MADHYGTLEGAATYHSDRGNAAWAAAATDALRTAALVRASFALDAAYAARFPGTRPGGQILAWPRTGATYVDGTAVSGTPTAVEYAAYELALRELASPGSMSPDVVTGKIKKRAKVGDIEVEYAVGSGSASEQRPISLVVEGMLADLLGPGFVPAVLVV